MACPLWSQPWFGESLRRASEKRRTVQSIIKAIDLYPDKTSPYQVRNRSRWPDASWASWAPLRFYRHLVRRKIRSPKAIHNPSSDLLDSSPETRQSRPHISNQPTIPVTQVHPSYNFGQSAWSFGQEGKLPISFLLKSAGNKGREWMTLFFLLNNLRNKIRNILQRFLNGQVSASLAIFTFFPSISLISHQRNRESFPLSVAVRLQYSQEEIWISFPSHRRFGLQRIEPDLRSTLPDLSQRMGLIW